MITRHYDLKHPESGPVRFLLPFEHDLESLPPSRTIPSLQDWCLSCRWPWCWVQMTWVVPSLISVFLERLAYWHHANEATQMQSNVRSKRIMCWQPFLQKQFENWRSCCLILRMSFVPSNWRSSTWVRQRGQQARFTRAACNIHRAMHSKWNKWPVAKVSRQSLWNFTKL